MREIKFRVWDVINKRILNYGEIMHLPMWEVFPGTPEQRAFNVMQYTGLNDKNGVEIYEGDIIEGGYLNPLTSEFLSRKYIIEYDKGSFKGKLIGHTPYGDTWLQFIEGEVIGNIYENKDLLEGVTNE